MKSLISGINGFIGKHLAERLKQLGHSVVPINRELLTDRSGLAVLMHLEKPDYIFHLAAYGNMSNQTDEEMIFTANVTATWNMLMASKNIPYKAFINFGSSSEYGRKYFPMKETDLPEADTFYGVTKIAATYFTRAFAKQFEKPIATIRPFSVYGPREADFRFIPTVIRAIEKNELLRLDPHGVHDWIYIDDVLDAIEIVMEYPQGVYNVGTGRQIANVNLVSLLLTISGKQVQTAQEDFMRPFDSKIWMANTDKLKSLGWKPNVSLEEGLRRTYEYYEQRLKA